MVFDFREASKGLEFIRHLRNLTSNNFCAKPPLSRNSGMTHMPQPDIMFRIVMRHSRPFPKTIVSTGRASMDGSKSDCSKSARMPRLPLSYRLRLPIIEAARENCQRSAARCARVAGRLVYCKPSSAKPRITAYGAAYGETMVDIVMAVLVSWVSGRFVISWTTDHCPRPELHNK